MEKEYDIEDEKFERLLIEKRHKEISGTLRAIAGNLSNNNDKAVVDAIKGQGEKFETLSKSIMGKPPINIDLNTKDFVTSILLIRDEIVESNKKAVIAYQAAEKSNIKLAEALENRLLPDTFTMEKSYGGVTESVKINYKPANQITIKK